MKKIRLLAVMLLATVCFVSCSSSNDDGFTLSDQVIYAGDSIKFSPNATVTNNFTAYISKSGYLHGFHVGETTVTLNGHTANVTVRGRYNAFKVQTDWTLSPDQLMAKQGGTPDRDVTNNGTRMIIYKNVGIANYLAYSFKNGKLTSAMAFSNPNDTQELLNFLNERYLILPEEVDSYTYLFVDAFKEADSKTLVMISLDTSVKTDYMLQTLFASTAAIKNTNNIKTAASCVQQIITQDTIPVE